MTVKEQARLAAVPDVGLCVVRQSEQEGQGQ